MSLSHFSFPRENVPNFYPLFMHSSSSLSLSVFLASQRKQRPFHIKPNFALFHLILNFFPSVFKEFDQKLYF